MNGALILDPKNRAVAKEKIDRSILAQILDEFEEYPFDFVNEDHILTRYPKKVIFFLGSNLASQKKRS